MLQTLKVKFVIRWIKTHKFFDSHGVEKKVWEIGRGKKYLAHTEIFDVPTGQKMPCDIWWTQVWHANYAYPLFCVKVRVKKKIWYLITNEPVKTAAQAWEIVFTYKRRWQIETSFRYGKCELAMESPRLWAFENRLKLLSIVTLVYAFLLHLLEPLYRDRVRSVLRLNAIEPESGIEIFSFAPLSDYAGQSVASGMSITLFLGVFSLQIWRHFRFWHLSNARKVSQKFGMTHSCTPKMERGE